MTPLSEAQATFRTACDGHNQCMDEELSNLRLALETATRENERLRDMIEIEREGQRSMAGALAEIRRLSGLNVAINHPAPQADACYCGPIHEGDSCVHCQLRQVTLELDEALGRIEAMEHDHAFADAVSRANENQLLWIIDKMKGPPPANAATEAVREAADRIYDYARHAPICTGDSRRPCDCGLVEAIAAFDALASGADKGL